MKYLLFLIPILLLDGCATMYGIPTMPSTELANAVAQADVSCISFPTPWGPGKAVIVSNDKGVIRNGSISANADCTITMTNTISAKP